jgi:ribosomal protein S18 acetylase RimI-like enzyme
MNSRLNILTKPGMTFEVVSKMNFSALYLFLAEVAPLYPHFDAWFNFTFRRNVASGERQIALAHHGAHIIGAALLKKTPAEHKICTFYINSDYRNMNVGHDLMDLALATLNSDDAVITVSAERNAELSPLLTAKGFSIYQSMAGYYRQASTEHFYKR